MQTITPQDLAVLAGQQPAMIGVHGFKMPKPDHPHYATVMAHAHKLTNPKLISDWRYTQTERLVTNRAGLEALDAGEDACFVVITELSQMHLIQYRYGDNGGWFFDSVWCFGSCTAVAALLAEHGITKIAG